MTITLEFPKNFPAEIESEILSYLTKRDLSRLGCCNQRLYTNIQIDPRWHSWLKKEFNAQYNRYYATLPLNYYKIYVLERSYKVVVPISAKAERTSLAAVKLNCYILGFFAFVTKPIPPVSNAITAVKTGYELDVKYSQEYAKVCYDLIADFQDLAPTVDDQLDREDRVELYP